MRSIPAFTAVLIASAAAVPGLAQESEPVFQQGDCPFDSDEPSENFQCGHITVPQVRDSPNGTMLRLAVAVARSFSETPRADPVVFLSGGPGQGVVAVADRYVGGRIFSAVREQRDVVFFDQRGTGLSDPEFCKELDLAFLQLQINGLPGAERRERIRSAFRDCRAKMLADGVDFTAYNSRTSAQDLDDIRRALDFAEWNLLGASYGTRLALAAMRDFPENIRSATLDAVAPPNSPPADRNRKFNRVLRLAFDRCADDPACRSRFPNIEAAFFRLLVELEASPIQIPIAAETGLAIDRIVVDGTGLADGIRQGFYDPRFIAVFPLVVTALEQRNSTILSALAENILSDRDRLSYGLLHAVDCYERIAAATPADLEADRIAFPGLAAWNDQPDEIERCAAWQPNRAPAETYAPVRSDIPVLAASGEFDPVTPPEYGRLALQTLPNGTHIEVPAMGHGAIPFSPCTRRIFLEFLDRPGAKPDTSCVGEMPELEFATDVRLNPGVYRLTRVAAAGASTANVLLGSVLLLVVSPLVVWPVRRWVRRRPQQSAGRVMTMARWASLAQAIAVAGAVAALAFGLVQTGNKNPYILAFGLTGESAWILWTPWLVLLTAVWAAASGVTALRDASSGRGSPVFVIVTAAGAIGLSAWCIYAGLI